MKNTLGKILVIMVATFMVCIAYPSITEAKSEIYKNWRGIAIKGYDPVAFHKIGKPVEGLNKYEHNWKGATWQFTNEEHLKLFIDNPEKYAPRYGGYCAWAVSQGYTASVDPKNAWSIVEGKLYLNYSAKVKETWEKDIPGNIEKADANWPGVLK